MATLLFYSCCYVGANIAYRVLVSATLCEDTFEVYNNTFTILDGTYYNIMAWYVACALLSDVYFDTGGSLSGIRVSNIVRSSPTAVDFSVAIQNPGVIFEVAYYTNVGNSFNEVQQELKDDFTV